MFCEWGYPDLLAYGPVLAHFIKQTYRPHITQGKALMRGQASRGGMASRPAVVLLRTPPEWWIFQGKAQPQESRMTQKKDTRAANSRTVQFPLWCKGGKDERRFPRHLINVSILVQQDPGTRRRDGRHP